MKTVFATLLSLFIFGGFAYGQETEPSQKETGFFTTDMDYQIQAYFSIGGSAPLGLPKEIREIKQYNPGLQLGLEANATKWFSSNSPWGIRLGVGVQGRGMHTEARVKTYYTKIIQNQSYVKGYYTGNVETDVKNVYLNIPLSVVYQLNSRWNIYAGLYAAILLNGEFSGYVSDGYLRQGTPVGPKIIFSDGSRAAYDFSENVNQFQWGANIGAEWELNTHFKLLANLNYGINGLLDDDFQAISFSMHNVYLDLGFAYAF